MAKLVRRLNIQRIRSEKKITQKELAEKTGFPQGYISKMERGIVSTSEMFINKVKEVFAIENIDETCNILGVHRHTLRRYTNKGKIRCGYHRVNGRKFYLGSEILRFWRSQL